MMLFNRAWFVIVMMLSIVALPIRINAASPTVIFSEIAWAGSSISSSDEWIELTNLTSETIDITGWTITGAGSSGKTLTLPEGTIAPYSTYLITNYENGNANTALSTSANFTTATLSLPNDGFTLALVDALGSQIDAAGGSGSPIAGGSGATAASFDGRYRSMVRVDGLIAGSETAAWTDATESSGFLEGVTDLGTPGVVEQAVDDVEAVEVVEAETVVEEEVVDPGFPSERTSDGLAGSLGETESTTEMEEEIVVTEITEGATEMVIEEVLSDLSVPSDQDVLVGTEEVVEVDKVDEVTEETVEAEVVDELIEEAIETVELAETAETVIDETTQIKETIISYAPGSILINEFVVDPLDEQTEWIELVNRSAETITLTDWTLEDATGNTTDLSSITLSPSSYVVMDSPNGKLNNDGDTIILRDATDLIIDSVSYGNGTLESPEDGMALARDSSDVFELTETTTPGETNVIIVAEEVIVNAVIASPAQLDEAISEESEAEIASSPEASRDDTATYSGPTTLRFSTLYPNTTGSDETEEYIEITNTGTESIDLLGWSIEDGSTDRHLFNQSQTVEPGTVMKILRTESGIALNNSGDTLELRDPNGEVIDTVSYGNAAKGSTYTFMNNTWTWSGIVSVADIVATPTSASVARTVSATPTSSTSLQIQTLTIEQSKNLSDGKRVRVEGIVTALPGVFARQTLYIMDQTGGIQIYFYDADFPELLVGQGISVTGEMSTSHGERRIKIDAQSDLVVTGKDVTLTPVVISIPEISEDQTGSLITTKGLVQSRESGKLIIEETRSELVVSLKTNPEIDAARFERGDRITVTGVLTSYDSELRIRPRTEDDIIIDESAIDTLALTTGDDGKSLFENSQARTGVILLLVTVASLALLAIRRNHARQLTMSTP